MLAPMLNDDTGAFLRYRALRPSAFGNERGGHCVDPARLILDLNDLAWNDEYQSDFVSVLTFPPVTVLIRLRTRYAVISDTDTRTANP